MNPIQPGRDKGLYISAAHKSSGKTILATGLCAALRARGFEVQPFKKGPDYIDPLWLGRAAQAQCNNLDFNTQSTEQLVECYSRSNGISIIEGNKGLHDGVSIDGSDSNAEMAALLNVPVILVLDAQGTTRGIAPLILGYQQFDTRVRFSGVILNKVAGSRHEQKLRSNVEAHTDLDVLGVIPRSSSLAIDERHIGLIPSSEVDDPDTRVEAIRQIVESGVDLGKLLKSLELGKPVTPGTDDYVSPDVRIGVPRDKAFGFYYSGDLEALKREGAEICFFDTLQHSEIPENLDGLFIGGGFPEVLGKIDDVNQKARPEEVIGGYAAHDSAMAAAREGCEVTLTALFKRQDMTATEEEVDDALHEGVTVLNGVMPVELLIGENGRATGLRMAECELDEKGIPNPVEGSEFELEADLIVSAIGQGGDLEGIEEMGNERQFIDADPWFRVPDREGHFVAGDIIRPHLLTTAIGQASIAVASVDSYLTGQDQGRRPKVDVHHFKLLSKLNETNLAPTDYDNTQVWGTDGSGFAIHNYEDRSKNEVIPSDKLFLAHFKYEARNTRDSQVPEGDEVLGNFEERHQSLSEEQTVAEAERCMSCGMCFECDNCVIYCPQDAVFRVKKDQSTLGRYVDTDYDKCIGCHICADVCPTGYIDMGLGK